MSKEKTNNYQATFIFDTRNYDQPLETLIDKMKGVIEAVKGVVKDVKNLGQKEFSRAADKRFTAGIYVRYTFEAPESTPAAIKDKLKLDRTVNRVMVESI